MLDIQEEKQSHDFQIVLLDRDKFGKPTGKKAYYSSNEGSKIEEFFLKHQEQMKARLVKLKGKSKKNKDNTKEKGRSKKSNKDNNRR